MSTLPDASQLPITLSAWLHRLRRADRRRALEEGTPLAAERQTLGVITSIEGSP
jgi:hypothetical protein